MKKMCKILMIILATIFISTNIYASSFDVIADPESIISKENAIIEINISFKDIDMNEEGINTVEGFIKYDKNIIASLELIEENNWKTKYNDDEQSELYGKFLSIKEVNGIKENETFLKLKIKLKDKITKEKGYILLDEITSNDGESLINIGKKEVEINIEKIDKEENQNKDDEEEIKKEENQNKKTEEEKNEDKTQEEQKEVSNQENIDSNQEKNNRTDKEEQDIEKENKDNTNSKNIKTGDIMPPVSIGIISIIIILNIALNIKRRRG